MSCTFYENLKCQYLSTLLPCRSIYRRQRRTSGCITFNKKCMVVSSLCPIFRHIVLCLELFFSLRNRDYQCARSGLYGEFGKISGLFHLTRQHEWGSSRTHFQIQKNYMDNVMDSLSRNPKRCSDLFLVGTLISTNHFVHVSLVLCISDSISAHCG